MPAAPDMRTMLGSASTDTFLGLKRCDLTAIPAGAKAVVIGAPCATPYDWVGPYSANAPRAIRESSSTYANTRHHLNFDLGGPGVAEGALAFDAGDIPYDIANGAGNREAIRAACAAVLAAGAVPIVLGGDDSIPIPVVQAYECRDPLTIVQIDAHIDWRDEVRGERFGLSSTMRRSSEMAHVGEMIQVGRRGMGSARPVDAADADRRGVRFFNAQDVHRHGIEPVLDAIPAGGDVLLTIDVDGLDPTTVPGVIGPEPGGLSYWQAIGIIDGVASRARIAGFDVVEFVPERDVNGLGALTVFRLAAHALGRILQR